MFVTEMEAGCGFAYKWNHSAVDRVVNGPTRSGPNPALTRHEPGPNRK